MYLVMILYRKSHVVISLLIIDLVTICQSQNQAEVLTSLLLNEGFENLRISSKKDSLFIAYENNVYRWELNALKRVKYILDSVPSSPPNQSLTVLKNDIPYIFLKQDCTSIRNDILSSDTNHLSLSTSSEFTAWNKVKGINPINSSMNKIDLVFYPQIKLQNTYFEKIYEIQLNISPAIEINLWPGMKFAGQIILPLKNDLNPEGDYI
ncbi:MAG: hypothetical protein K9I94_14275, partial [Bacteroidales bacterium]|nr:hypothetical protein [Bacteroidales bacterium]